MAASGGRPTAALSAQLGDRIVAAAAELFLRDGYAATSIEAIASLAGVSKRTFYARFDGKPAVFLDVVRVLIRDWLTGFDATLEEAQALDEALLTVARKMLDVALTPTALQLYALVTAESLRLPEITQALRQAGVDGGKTRVAAILQRYLPHLSARVAGSAAEQFQGMVVHAPQRRAMARAPMDAADREDWCRSCVALLLHGVGNRAA